MAKDDKKILAEARKKLIEQRMERALSAQLLNMTACEQCMWNIALVLVSVQFFLTFVGIAVSPLYLSRLNEIPLVCEAVEKLTTRPLAEQELTNVEPLSNP